MNVHAPALRVSLSEVVAEYEAKLADLPRLAEELKEAAKACEMASQIGGNYGGTIWGRSGAPGMVNAERVLRSSAWRHVYAGLKIELLATASERKRFERELEDPPEFTIDNIRANFGDYIVNPRASVLRGLAEVFVQLDPAYKSHSKVRIGVKGLPKRIVLGGFGGYSDFGRDRLRDILYSIAACEGRPAPTHSQISDLVPYATTDTEGHGVKIKRFLNGNAHIHFSPETLLTVNRGLAEFYGDVLPDVADDGAVKRTGTNVSADLSYYPTPAAVCKAVMYGLHLPEGSRVLEPSCGCGRLLDAAKAHFPAITLRGIEYHGPRAAEARAKGHAVQVANFLEVPADPTFDAVIMNPPFAGAHWKKHLAHAKRFLRNNARGRGMIKCILPASAWYDGHLTKKDGQWSDLPVASFAESGTNVPTGIFTTWRAGE